MTFEEPRRAEESHDSASLKRYRWPVVAGLLLINLHNHSAAPEDSPDVDSAGQRWRCTDATQTQSSTVCREAILLACFCGKSEVDEAKKRS